MAGSSDSEIREELASYGANLRIQELERQIAAIRAAFPTLARIRKPHMSPAARKAASVRMSKYWAERRKNKATSAAKRKSR
jgi:hypothetical protein